MNIVITGGAGYIGSYTTGLLLSLGHNITVIDPLWFNKDVPLFYRANPRYKFLKGTIGDLDLIDQIIKNGVDYLIHAAAVVGEPASKKFPELTHKVNYEDATTLIERLRKTNLKGFIFISTCSNYGISEGVATEESPLNPLSLYAKTKVDVERFLMNEVKGLDWVICRLATVYGVSPRMRFDLTVNDFAMNALTRKYLDIFLPYTSRPYIHVSSVAKVLSRILDKFDSVKNQILNIGFNKEDYQKIQIAEIVKRLIPDTRIEIVKKGIDKRDYRVDFSKLRKYLNTTNTHTVEEGVKETIELLKSGKIDNPRGRIYHNTSPEL
jgi:nucleoside-diphosphate-sugar epimerase